MKKFILSAGLVTAALVVAYLATLGCCRLLQVRGSSGGWSDRLGLTAEQRERVRPLEQAFARQSGASCGTLCAKRAQMIALLKRPDPDRAVLAGIVEEIGAQQTALEKATLDHILAVAGELDPPQRERMVARLNEELRTACRRTACGMSGVCLAER